MRSAARRRWAVSALAFALAGALAACGGDESSAGQDASSDTASSQSAAADEYPFDLTDPGEESLDQVRRGVVIEGTETEVSWKFPKGYQPISLKQATTADGDIDYDVAVGAKPDVTPEDEAQSIAERADEENDTETYEVTVGDRVFSVVTLSSRKQGLSLTGFFHAPEDESVTYAVLFTAGVALDEVPEKRLDELHQMVASLEFEPRGS